MGDKIKRLVDYLASQRVDLYQHIAASAVITALVVVLCQLAFHSKNLSFVMSAIVMLSATFVKELYIDRRPDVVDIAFNFIGAIVIWVVFFIG